MSKSLLLASVSVIIFSSATFAKIPNADIDHSSAIDTVGNMLTKSMVRDQKEVDLHSQPTPKAVEYQRLPAELVADFAKFSYTVNKNKDSWKEEEQAIYNKLINQGWVLDTFKGTTGTANNQVESESGLLAFKDGQVVIATRGTEMTNWYDWMTNFRFSRSPLGRLYSDEANKISSITAQAFYGVDGEIANGFLQTHLSSWDYIKEAIIKYAASIGKTPAELDYTITGHSKGAAKAQLNALHLLTDSTLAVGLESLEASTILTKSTAGLDLTESQLDIWGSGFYMPSVKSDPKNKGNLEIVAFESPHVFSNETAAQANKIIGTDKLVRIENEGVYDFDPVTKVTPKFLGFDHAGTKVGVDGKGTFVGRHGLGNVRDAAILAIDAHRAKVISQESVPESPQDEDSPEKTVSNPVETEKTQDGDSHNKTTATQTEQVSDDYFGKSIVEGARNVWNSITDTASSAWNYFFG
jgi:hypothetical protein